MATYWENSCSFGLRYVSWYKYLIVSLVFSHLGFWSGNLFLIAPFPDLCLLVSFHVLLNMYEETHSRPDYFRYLVMIENLTAISSVYTLNELRSILENFFFFKFSFTSLSRLFQ